jgi:tetratricopeptide (TPR) repeat protein
MGASALAGGQGPLARESLERMRDLGGKFTADTALDLAVACYYALQVPDAKRYADEALELDPDNDEAAMWREKLDGFKNDHDLIVDVARAHCRAGRLGVGAELFTHSFEFGDSFEARFHGGQAMLGIDRVDNAVALLGAAVDMDPDDQDAAEALAIAEMIAEGMGEAEELDEQAEEETVLPATEPPPVEAETPEAGAEPAPTCPTCGHQLKLDAVFCPSCGRRVG